MYIYLDGHIQSVVSCVKLLCERLSFVEPPDVTEAVYNLRRACRVATFPEAEGQSGVEVCVFDIIYGLIASWLP